MLNIIDKGGHMKQKTSYAVVTGASSGIGAELARRLAKEGFRLVLVARRRERLQSLADEIGKMGQDCIVFPADLAKIKECKRLMSELEGLKVTVFVNNAGFGACGSFLDTDTGKELQMIDVNIRAVHLLTKLVLLKMQKQGKGYLINVASSAGLMPAGPYMAAYYATKSYVASMTRAVAEEFREMGSPVYVGCLCPGPVNTEFNEVADVEFALPGISAKYCADYAVKQMKKRKTVIVPTIRMKLAMTVGRFLPQKMYIRIAAHQQKRKLSRS